MDWIFSTGKNTTRVEMHKHRTFNVTQLGTRALSAISLLVLVPCQMSLLVIIIFSHLIQRSCLLKLVGHGPQHF